MKEKKPAIIIGKSLVQIFDNGISALDIVALNLSMYEKIGGLASAYLYAYSIFEGTLFQIYSRVLKAFPKKAVAAYKLDETNLLFETSRTSVVIEKLCDNFSYNFGHERFRKFITNFNKIVGIDISPASFPEEILDNLKITRNKIAHQGDNPSLEQTLQLIETVKESLSRIREKFVLKYDKYTDIELIRRSCAYIFNMSDNEFNDCFVFNKGHVNINLKSIEAFYERLSSSETHCFLLFIANYNSGISDKFKIKDLMPRISLTDSTIDRISFINDLFEMYPYLINR